MTNRLWNWLTRRRNKDFGFAVQCWTADERGFHSKVVGIQGYRLQQGRRVLPDVKPRPLPRVEVDELTAHRERKREALRLYSALDEAQLVASEAWQQYQEYWRQEDYDDGA